MAKTGTGTKIAIAGCVLVLFLSFVVCCGGGLALVIGGPAILVGLVVQDQPLEVYQESWDEAQVQAVADRLATDLANDNRVRVTGEELSQLVRSSDDADELEVFRLDVDEQGRGVLDLSVQMDPTQPQYLNVHVVGEMTMEGGWFTEFVVDELTIGKIDLGQYVAGQDITNDANNSLAQQRVQDPDTAEFLDMIELLTVEDGAFVLELTDDAVARLQTEGKL